MLLIGLFFFNLLFFSLFLLTISLHFAFDLLFFIGLLLTVALYVLGLFSLDFFLAIIIVGNLLHFLFFFVIGLLIELHLDLFLWLLFKFILKSFDEILHRASRLDYILQFLFKFVHSTPLLLREAHFARSHCIGIRMIDPLD